jgi:adenosine deaminase
LSTWRICSTILLAVNLASACAPSPDGEPETLFEGANANKAFERIRQDPPALAALLRAFPKGGDLHNHLVGAIYAESYLDWAAKDQLCISTLNFAFSRPPCSDVIQPVAKILENPALYGAAIDALSMRDFVPGSESGHDHFFNTFAKFELPAQRHQGEMLAEVASRAATEHELYLELMISPGMDRARILGNAVGWHDDFDALSTRLFRAGLRDVVKLVRNMLDESEREQRSILRCDENPTNMGCGLVIRYIAQVYRDCPPEQVYAQTLLGFLLSETDPRFVGVNLVGPEDNPVSLRDYSLQMRIVKDIKKRYPGTHVTLHAGELVIGLVAPEDLQFHIKEAVEIASADRIGHGVDIVFERAATQLLDLMARKRVLVEISLTSNEKILGIRGNEHPIRLYWAYGVPMALSSDDEGVSRIDLTNEYVRAAMDYDFSYTDLKTISRNSLEYSFLPGRSLWRGARFYAFTRPCEKLSVDLYRPSTECAALMAASEKARLQWSLERAFAEFEAVHLFRKASQAGPARLISE